MKYMPVVLLAVVLGCTDDSSPDGDRGSSPRPPDPAMLSESSARAAVFDCEEAGFSFTVRPLGDSLAVWLPQRFERPFLWLPRARAASGARYAGDGVVVWTRQDEASLDVDDETFEGCARDNYASVWEEAKLSGVDFRALGNEPGWIIDLTGDGRVHLRMDYGENEFTIRRPDAETSDSATVYHAATDSHQVHITIRPEPCTDSMSGKAFESTVTAIVDGKTYHGCGRPLH